MNYNEWHKIGYQNGWCGPEICITHDGLPTTPQEDEEYETGDPCIHIIRLYPNNETKNAVETNHSPSIWRATNAKLDTTREK